MTKYCLHCQSETNHANLYGIEQDPITFVYDRNNETIERGSKAIVYYCEVCGLIHMGIATAPIIEEQETTAVTDTEQTTETPIEETNTETTTNE